LRKNTVQSSPPTKRGTAVQTQGEDDESSRNRKKRPESVEATGSSDQESIIRGTDPTKGRGGKSTGATRKGIEGNLIKEGCLLSEKKKNVAQKTLA